jgi:hypothetical protein
VLSLAGGTALQRPRSCLSGGARRWMSGVKPSRLPALRPVRTATPSAAPDGRERQPASALELRTRNGPEGLSRRRRPVRRGGAPGMSSAHADLPRIAGTRLHRSRRCHGGTGPEPESRVRHRHCSDASRAVCTNRCRLAYRRRLHPAVTGAVSLLPPRALEPRCTSPHRSPGGACQARRGRTPSITAVCPRTLALGTYRNRRSHVGSARSLFSSQATDAAFVLTPSGLSSGRHTATATAWCVLPTTHVGRRIPRRQPVAFDSEPPACPVRW